MKNLSKLRLFAQRLVGSTFTTPLEVARWMLAVQAQDLPAAKWALGIRAPGTVLADVDAALTAGTIVRSWPMRGTLHLTPAEDLKWMLALATPRVLAGAKARQQALKLDDKTFGKARDVAHKVLAGKKQLTRSALLDEVWGIDTKISTRTVDAHVKRLREKMGAARDYIETVRGVGYRFAEVPVAEQLGIG